jgi:glucose-1-phosphate thymidylyltransferase
MEIARAVIVAADCRGAEPWPDLGLAARQLVPIANRPVLFHHLDALAEAGVRAASIVTDAATRAGIWEAVGDGSEWDMELSHLGCDNMADGIVSAPVADSVSLTPVLVHHGDVLLRERYTALEDDFADQDFDALILRPRGGDGDASRRSAGYIIGPHIHPPVGRGVAALDDALQQLSMAGARIGVREVDACMPCRGGADELLEANRQMLANVTPERGERVFESRIQGLVSLHPSAEVRGSVLRGPVAIGPGSRISDAYVGPYTSIGAGVELDCVEIEHSIVLDQAQIRFLESRVEGSVIGPGARVTRDFHVPRGARLSIGEGALVSLA